MKQLVKYLLLVGLSIAGCTHVHPDRESAAEVSILIDVTDRFQLKPDSSLFLLYDFENAPNMAAKYKIGIIADKYFTPKRENELEDGDISEANNKTDDPNYREKRIRAFYCNFCSDLNNLQRNAAPVAELQFSLCYQPVAVELARLSASKARFKSLIVFSDLREKSELFDCYSYTGQQLLSRKPDSVIALFKRVCPLPANLAGIRVYIFHCPSNRQEDAVFRQMVQIYSQLIEQNGGRVFIETTYPALINKLNT